MMSGVQGGRPGLPLWLRKPRAVAAGSGRAAAGGHPALPCSALAPELSHSRDRGLIQCPIINSRTSDGSGMGAVPRFSWGVAGWEL